MDIDQNNSQDLIKIVGFISVCLASIYYALVIAKTLNIVYALIIIIAIIVIGLIIFRKIPVRFPSITVSIAVVTMFIILLAIVGTAIHLEPIVEIAARLEPILPILIIVEIILLLIHPFLPPTTKEKNSKTSHEPDISMEKGSDENAKQPIVKRSLPPPWNVPYQQNLNFTGRKTYLEKLQSMLNSGQSNTQKVTIYGLGGVGKTQLAIEYSFRNIAKYSAIWWVRSESQEALVSDYVALATDLDLPAKAKGYTDQSVVIKTVKRWLEHNPNWLLIFDNAQRQEDLINYLPQGGAGDIIITSRNPRWGNIAELLQVDVFDRAESIDFLCKRTMQDDKNAANTLAEELGDLPLALEQASAYIERTYSTLSKYMVLFQSRRQELWIVELPPTDYLQTVATTWSLSMDQVHNDSPVAADILNLCAFLDTDDVPLKLFSEGKRHLPESLTAMVTDPLVLNSAIEALRRYSLVNMSDDTLSLHRLVQVVIRDHLEMSEKKIWTETALHIISDAFPIISEDPESIDMQRWLDCSRLLPHALATYKHAEILEVTPELISNILNQSGSYLREIGDLIKAKELHEKALKLAGDFYREKHPCIAICHENLGRVLRDIGELKKAKEHYEVALKIDKDSYGKDHPHIAICEDGLGRVLLGMNELEAAKKRFERALEIDVAINSPQFKVAIRLNNIGSVFHDLRDYR